MIRPKRIFSGCYEKLLRVAEKHQCAKLVLLMDSLMSKWKLYSAQSGSPNTLRLQKRLAVLLKFDCRRLRSRTAVAHKWKSILPESSGVLPKLLRLTSSALLVVK